MRKFTINAISVIAVLMFFFFSANSQNPGQTSYHYHQGEKCGTMEWLNAMFREYPDFRAQYEENERKLGEAIKKRLEEQKKNPNAGRTESITYIPVVFHVVLTAAQHNNLTDAMIMAQLDTLNKDFSGFNADSANIPPQFQAVRGHSNYLFCLAQRTPTGQPTTGIVRVISSTLSSGPGGNDPIKSTALGGSDAWDPTRYINIWLGNFTNPSLLGYATFPIGSPENPSGPLNQQGIVCLAQTVPGGTAAPYNRGRTATHELGHYFWLRHIWGDSNCGNDFPNTPGIDDTPSQSNATFGCPAQAPNIAYLNTNCPGFPNPPGRMFQNFMDYTDDACMTMFTNGQNIRAEMAINMFRPGLLTSNGCLAPSGFQFNNPAPATSACPAPASMSITLNVIGNGGFSNPVTLSASGNPGGTTVSFSANPVTPTPSPGTPVTVTLNGTNTLNFGSYVINVLGTATGAPNQNVNLTYTINQGAGPAITTQPANQTVCAGGNATFSITSATATAFQWQVSTDGGATYSNVTNGGVYSGATTNTLNISGATAGMNNYRYRCIASTQCGASTSAAGILAVNTAPSISGHPQNTTLCAGSNHTFSVTATGTSLTYQWQEDAGSGFVNVTNGGIYSGATTANLTLTGITAGMNGYRYRCVVSGACSPNATSNEATLTVVVPVSVTTHPNNSTICDGGNTSFTAAGSGTGVIYQWQVNTGSGFVNVTNGGVYSGATTGTLTITGATTTMNGYQYRCQMSNAVCTAPVFSNAATLTVQSLPSISSHPSGATICAGSNQSFSVSASGTGITYQWQVNTGSGFSNLSDGGVYSGSGTATLNISGATTALTGYQYRCVVSGTCAPPATSNAATLTVIAPPTVTAQPSNRELCSGSNTSFSVTGTSTQAIIYQWQENRGSGFVNVTDGGVYSGATTATLTISGAATAMSGYQYRCLLSNATCTSPAISGAATLTVRQLPTVGLTTTSNSLLPGQTATLTATPSATTGGTLTTTWLYNGNTITNTGNSRVVNVEQIGSYQVQIREVWPSGLVCANASPTIAIDAPPSQKLFIFPSPNNGQFTVSYYNSSSSSVSRTVTIYDSRGARMYNRRFIVTGPYTLIPVDLRPAQSGVYHVVVGDAGGNKLISGKVMVKAQ